MSDYVYMLESHLSPDQNRVVEDVQSAAAQTNVNLFLTGGAMRDMLAGLRIRGDGGKFFIGRSIDNAKIVDPVIGMGNGNCMRRGRN